MSEILKAVDVSSHQSRDLSEIIAEYQPDHIITKLYMPWESVPFDHTQAQVESARQHGLSVGGYVWAYRSIDPIATIDAVIHRCSLINLVLPILWIDCETYAGPPVDPGPDADWLTRAVNHAQNAYEMPCGIYTGRWWIRDHFPGGESTFSGFAPMPLWLAEYDGNPDIDDVDTLPQGWSQVAAKQYAGSPVDQNVIRSEYTRPLDAPPPPGEPNKDEIIEGLRIALDDIAYVRLGEDIAAMEAAITRMKATREEARRIREQFLGE